MVKLIKKIFLIFTPLLFMINTATAGNVFIDHVDGDVARVCSETDPGQWVCQTVSVETLKLIYGLVESEGYLWLERPDQLENEK